jgi:hypothetical protein
MVYRRYFDFIFAFISLFIGGFIYICFRDKNSLFFSLLRCFKINYSIFSQINFRSNIVTTFIIYCLPNGLWVLSGLLLLKTLLKYGKMLVFYSIVFIIISLFYEIGQYFNIVSGTFDILDIVTIITFSLIGLLVNTLRGKYEKN